MKQNMKKGRVKGTVLFTVVSIMMVMVVFLMSTLILTTSAQRRAYYTYFETQAQYAAKAALDTVENTVFSAETGQEFYEFIMAGAPNVGESVSFAVSFENSEIPITKNDHGDKIVVCTIECAEPEFYWDEKNRLIIERQTWTISATAEVGSGRNAATATSARKIYTPYRDKIPDPDNNGASWEGVKDGEGGDKGAGIFASSLGMTAGNVSVMGPMTSNVVPMGRTKYGTDYANVIDHGHWQEVRYDWDGYANIGNTGDFAGLTVYVNNNAFTGSGKKMVLSNPGDGLIIYGNYAVQNDQKIVSNFKTLPKQYNQLAFMYVEGAIIPINSGWTIGDPRQPVNVYAGALDISNPQGSYNIHGDTYLYETTLDTTLRMDGSKLATFISNNIKKANYDTNGYTGGDIISNNKSFSVRCQNGLEIGGDLIFTNPDGVMTFLGDPSKLTVNGTIVCAGKLVIQRCTITAKGGIYVDPNNLTIETGTTINGKTYDGGDKAAYLADVCGSGAGVTKKDHTVTKNSGTSAYVESLDETFTGANYNAVITAMKNWKQTYIAANGNKVTVEAGLFPFCSRQDEIFETYIRWDLQKNTEAEARAAMNNDAFVQESKDAGHTWNVKEKKNGSKTIWVPYTSSRNKDKHSFIKELVTGTDAMTPPSKYYDSVQNNFPTEDYTAQAANAIDCTYYYHTPNGTPANKTISAYRITSSCIIDGQSNKTFYIDPSVKGYTDTDPLILHLKGNFSETTFIVNNTFNTTAGQYYAEPLKDANGNPVIKDGKTAYTFASRRDVLIYLDNGFSGNKFKLFSTGSMDNLSDLDYVANPYYPGTREWDALRGAEKYKFEYIPNVTINGANGGTFNFSNDTVLSAFVVMPTSNIYVAVGYTILDKVLYRANHEDVAYKPTSLMEKRTIGIGGFQVSSFGNQNTSFIFYATDGNRPGSTGGSISEEEIVVSSGNYFENDYNKNG